MDSSLIVPLVTGSGVAGIFCVLFITGWVYPRGVVKDLKAEVAELKQAAKARDDRDNAAAAAQSTVKDILAALAFGQQHGTPGLAPEGERAGGS